MAIVLTTYFPPGEVGKRRMDAAERAINSWLRNMYDFNLTVAGAVDGSA